MTPALAVPCALLVLAWAPLAAQQAGPGNPPGHPPGNPYGIEPWHADYPVPLVLPHRAAPDFYERTRRQALEQVVANLQGNVRREAWQMATEFFWRAPPDCVEPLIAMMDRWFGREGMHDMVKNVLEAMAKAASREEIGPEAFDDALRRALEHPNPVVHQAVFAAMATAASAATIRRCAAGVLGGMDGRARKSWLRAARLRLGDEAVTIFRNLMVPEVPIDVRDQVVLETLELAPADAARVLEALWPDAQGEFKTLIAGVRHAAGVSSGTLWLQQALASENIKTIVHALRQLTRGAPGPLLNQLLELSTHPEPQVRLEVARVLTTVPDEGATRALETLAAPDEFLDIKKVAVRELTRRGRTDTVTFLLEEMATATGTRLRVQSELLVASGDPRAVAVFRERFLEAPATEGRQFLQALAFCGAPGAAEALLELFLGPERPVTGDDAYAGTLTTVNYIPVLLPNLRGSEPLLLQGFHRIPAGDHVRRAHYLQALTTIAADRTDEAVRAPIVGLLRSLLFDREQPPQLRIQALNSLTQKFLDLDDAMRLKRLQEPVGDRESPRLRALWKDFLFEYF